MQDQRFFIDLNLPPGPVLGLHAAPVVLLSADPGRDDPGDYEACRRPGAVRDALDNARSPAGTPVRWLSDELAGTPGGRWWRKLVRGPQPATGLDFSELAAKVLMIEHHGYHSSKWSPPPVTLPSQPYGFELARQAMGRGAALIMLRAARVWKIAVPGLGPVPGAPAARVELEVLPRADPLDLHPAPGDREDPW